MCKREHQKLLHKFEVEECTQKNVKNKRSKADVSKTVKAFSRCAAGKATPDPWDLRPAPVLATTMNYLLEKIAPREDVPWNIVYDFVADRIRAVRQDIVIQHLPGDDTCQILMQCIRFYLYSSYRLCEEPLANFDPHLNNIQAMECMKMLLVNFSNMRNPPIKEAQELEALYLLFNLGSTDAMLHAYECHRDIRECAKVRLALNLNRAYMEGNYVHLFRLVRKLTFLEMCSMHRHVPKLHRLTIQQMSVAYSSKVLTYPVEQLRRLLLLDTECMAADLCRYYGITIDGKRIRFIKAAWNDADAYRKSGRVGMAETGIDVPTDASLESQATGHKVESTKASHAYIGARS
ncbi:PREDICTED: SAC3 domain-containing protein 1-like [Priapulus caudatus]|uniref:SAC3 domain-containing protein 1-like n=1 Tax=Priapulus caudatus TaxID=37621 RepID=A0ABM1ETC9_PRICU|nr:PREDICTED: SAC3 domain-containing protein 1-like [Priapulus caudatus]